MKVVFVLADESAQSVEVVGVDPGGVEAHCAALRGAALLGIRVVGEPNAVATPDEEAEGGLLKIALAEGPGRAGGGRSRGRGSRGERESTDLKT